jgi:hypothetical protein
MYEAAAYNRCTVVAELADDERRVFEPAEHDRDVDFGTDELGSARRRDHVDVDLRVPTDERADHGGKFSRHLGRCRDVHDAARLARGLARQHRRFVETGDGLAGALVVRAAGVGERDPPRRALEQHDAEILLELRNAAAHRGRG